VARRREMGGAAVAAGSRARGGRRHEDGLRVLIADDDPTSRLLLKDLVTELGHECLVAADAAQAWEILSSRPVDALLTGRMMSGVDGPDFFRRVREAGDNYVYIVLTAELDHLEHAPVGMHAGADDYLIKPVESFAVQTRLVAAARVTGLHGELARTRAELDRANSELLERSLTDGLTGLGNRCHMEEDLARTHARARRLGLTYGVAVFDVDHFTRYNDHYGHVAGDEALRSIASTIHMVVRAGECAYRYGGGHFLLLMPECRPTDSILMAGERVRQAVVEAARPHGAGPSSPSLITLSGGVSSWSPGSSLTPVEVLGEAEQALFQAKSDGRNRVYAAPSVDGCVDQAPAFTTPGR
jgi:diguanylate cyclase (GGDEF)-like protein